MGGKRRCDVPRFFCWTRGENPLSLMGVDSPLFFLLWKRLRGGDYSDYSDYSEFSDYSEDSDYSDYSDSLAANP